MNQITLLDIMGSDEAIVEAARISYQSAKIYRPNRDLIRYLMRHGHLSPFEMCIMKFRITLPMDIMRQVVRHRTASINERSSRYTVLAPDDTFLTPYRTSPDTPPVDLKNERSFLFQAIDFYNTLLSQGVPREQARRVLPLSTPTEIIWTCDLRNIFNFLRQRLAPEAQEEIRILAQELANHVKAAFPLAYEAFEDYILNAQTFTAPMSAILADLLKKLPKEDIIKAIDTLPGVTEGERKEIRKAYDKLL